MKSLTGGTEEMLDQSIDRVEKTLKHTRFALTAIGPALLVGGLVAGAAEAGAAGLLPALGDFPLFRILWLGHRDRRPGVWSSFHIGDAARPARA